MATSFSVNNTPATGADAMYLFMQNLIASGMTIQSSSDGTNYGAGNLITSGGTGTGGLGNSYAWFVYVTTNNTAYCWQRAASNNQDWSFTTSPSNSFTGGNATTRPTASDVEPGGNFYYPFLPADGTNYFNCWSDGVQHYFFSLLISNSALSGLITVETASPSFDTTTSPTAVVRGVLTINAFSTAGYYNNQFFQEASRSIGFGISPLYPWLSGGFNQTGIGGADILQPILWMRTDEDPQGLKGITTAIYENATQRSTGDTTSLNSAGDGICINSSTFHDGVPLVLPWNGSTPLGGNLTNHPCVLAFVTRSGNGGGANGPANPFDSGLS